MLSVLTGVLLVCLKFSVWSISGSISVLASSLDSLLDIIASLITFFAVRIAIKPADEDHHFGHGKAEQLAVLAQMSFIAGSAIYLIFYAINALFHGSTVYKPNLAIYAMIFSIIITCILLIFQRYVVMKTQSSAIRADAMHYGLDIIVNIGVLLALALAKFGYLAADAIISIIIAFIMLISVKKLGWDAIDLLMDKALSEETLIRIRDSILQHKDVVHLRELRTKQSHSAPTIQFCIDVNENLVLRKAHDIGCQVQKTLFQIVPNADIIFRIYPIKIKNGNKKG